MREIRLSGSEGGGAKPIVSPYPYCKTSFVLICSREREPRRKAVASARHHLQDIICANL
jgi:hypothetical protein